MRVSRVASIVVVVAGCLLLGLALVRLVAPPKEFILGEGQPLSEEDADFVQSMAKLLSVSEHKFEEDLTTAHIIRYWDSVFAFLKMSDRMLTSIKGKDLVFSTKPDASILEESDIDDLFKDETQAAPSWFKKEVQSLTTMEVYVVRQKGTYNIWLIRDLASGNLYCRLMIPHHPNPRAGEADEEGLGSALHNKQTE